MSVVLIIGTVLLTLAAAMVLVRMAWGPTMLDRIVAFDVLVAVIICALGLEAAVNQHATTLPIILTLSLLGFVGSASVASFSKGSQTVEGDRP
ncbi:monovalent cation/H+ antiporter complex subunit F [Nocardioides pakistanensis]